MNSIYLPNDSKPRKTRARSTFMAYPASVVSLIFLAETLIWNSITFSSSNSLNLAELVVNKPTKSIYKKITNMTFSIRFIAG